MTTVAANAQAVGDSKDKYLGDIQGLLLSRDGSLTPGAKAAALQIATDGLAFVLAAQKGIEKGQTYQF